MVLDEINLLVRHSGFSYSDIENMSIYKRRYFINLRHKEAEAEKKHIESARK